MENLLWKVYESDPEVGLASKEPVAQEDVLRNWLNLSPGRVDILVWTSRSLTRSVKRMWLCNCQDVQELLITKCWDEGLDSTGLMRTTYEFGEGRLL